MFSSNPNEKRALKTFLKHADKKGGKNKLVNSNENSQEDEDEDKNHKKSGRGITNIMYYLQSKISLELSGFKSCISLFDFKI